MAFVEGRDGLQDRLKRVSLVLARITRGEAVQAFATLVHLQPAHPVPTLSFLDAVGALARRTRRSFFGAALSASCCSWCD